MKHTVVNLIRLLFCVFLCIYTMNAGLFAQLSINEVCSKNNAVLFDFEGDAEDWIEIKNIGYTPIQLNNYFLSDDPTHVQKWQFPNYVLYPDNFIVVFASAKDVVNNEEIHTNFKLSSNGETILLSHVNYLVDEVSFPSLQANHSYGKKNNAVYKYYGTPTPNQSNELSADYWGYSTQPSINRISSFYPDSVSISVEALNTSPDIEIRYTLDGSSPNKKSNLLNTLVIDSTTVLNVVAIEPDYLPSPIVHRSFFFGEETTYPIVSLIFPPEYFWGYDGLYGLGLEGDSVWPFDGANFWKDIEKTIHLEYFDEDRDLQIDDYFGVKIHGGTTRSQAMKSLRIMAKSKHGPSTIDYPFFPDRPFEKSDQIILRNAGNDFRKAHCRDAFYQEHLLDANIDLEMQYYKPVIVYLNGEYWGIHNLRERIDEDFLGRLYDIDEDELDFIDRNNVSQGNLTQFDMLMSLVLDYDLSNETNYNNVAAILDIDNCIDYFACELFCNNADWLNNNNNIRFWRPYQEGATWRYILVDTDTGFSLFDKSEPNIDLLGEVLENADSIGNPHAIMFKRLLQNTAFKNQFVNRYCDLLNTTLSAMELDSSLSLVKNYLDLEIERHHDKWGHSASTDVWENEFESISEFINQRKDNVFEHLDSNLNLGNRINLSFFTEPSNLAEIELNSLSIYEDWSGDYFSDIPISLSIETDIEETIEDSIGYAFNHWLIEYESGNTLILYNQNLIFSFFTSAQVTAVFLPYVVGVNQLELSKALSIYPNPVQNEKLYIKSEEILTDASFSVYNSAAQKVLEGDIFNTANPNIDISDLPNGTYYLLVNDAYTQRQYGTKFVVL